MKSQNKPFYVATQHATLTKQTHERARNMQIKTQITAPVLAAAVSLLQPYIPELSTQNLITAIKNYDNAQRPLEKQMTRKEAAAILAVDINTISRYIKAGTLKAAKIGKRAVRIDPQSVRALAERGALAESEIEEA